MPGWYSWWDGNRWGPPPQGQSQVPPQTPPTSVAAVGMGLASDPPIAENSDKGSPEWPHASDTNSPSLDGVGESSIDAPGSQHRLSRGQITALGVVVIVAAAASVGVLASLSGGHKVRHSASSSPKGVTQSSLVLASCGRPTASSSHFPDDAPQSAVVAVWHYANSPRISAVNVSLGTLGKIQGTLDPCDDTWATFAVNYPLDDGGGATTIAHFSGGKWVPDYLGDGYGLQQEIPSAVYVDLFGGELGCARRHNLWTVAGGRAEKHHRLRVRRRHQQHLRTTGATGLGTLENYNCPPGPSSCTKSPTFTPDYQIYLSHPKTEALNG